MSNEMIADLYRYKVKSLNISMAIRELLESVGWVVSKFYSTVAVMSIGKAGDVDTTCKRFGRARGCLEGEGRRSLLGVGSGSRSMTTGHRALPVTAALIIPTESRKLLSSLSSLFLPLGRTGLTHYIMQRYQWQHWEINLKWNDWL